MNVVFFRGWPDRTWEKCDCSCAAICRIRCVRKWYLWFKWMNMIFQSVFRGCICCVWLCKELDIHKLNKWHYPESIHTSSQHNASETKQGWVNMANEKKNAQWRNTNVKLCDVFIDAITIFLFSFLFCFEIKIQWNRHMEKIKWKSKNITENVKSNL